MIHLEKPMNDTLREASAIEGFGSLAQPTRLAAVRHLLAVHPQSLSAGEIARLCEVPHNTMSTHLGISAAPVWSRPRKTAAR